MLFFPCTSFPTSHPTLDSRPSAQASDSDPKPCTFKPSTSLHRSCRTLPSQNGMYSISLSSNVAHTAVGNFRGAGDGQGQLVFFFCKCILMLLRLQDIFADYAAWNNDDTEVPYQPLPLPPRASTSQTPSSRLYSSLPPWPIAHPTIPAKSINVLQGPAFSGSVLARHQASYPVHPAITPVPPPSPNAQSPCSPLSSHPTPSRTICTSSLRPRSTPVEDEEEEVHDLINHATCSDAEGTPLSAQAPGDRLERPHSDGSYAGQLDDQHTEPECDREQLDDEDAQPNDQLDELAAALQDDPTDDPFGDRIVPLIIESEPSASDDDYQEDSATHKSSKGCSF